MPDGKRPNIQHAVSPNSVIEIGRGIHPCLLAATRGGASLSRSGAAARNLWARADEYVSDGHAFHVRHLGDVAHQRCWFLLDHLGSPTTVPHVLSATDHADC